MKNNDVIRKTIPQLQAIRSYCQERLDDGVRTLFEQQALHRILHSVEQELARR